MALGTQFLTAIGATNVVLFERDQTSGQRLAEYLRKKGFVIQILDDAQSTIRAVRQGQISVVVLGFSEELEELPLCQALKEGDEPPAVIGLFERDLTHELNARLEPESWPDQFFVRPVSFHQILHAIEEELAAREGRDAAEAPPPLLFVEALATRWRHRETGMLHVTTEGLQTTIYIKEGVPVFAEQGSLGDTLGRILLRTGKITNEQFSAAVDLITQNLVDNEQLRLGEALVKLGFLTAEEVMEALREQMQAKILACFRLERFHSDFKPGAEHLEGVGSFEIPFGRLLMRGIKDEVVPARLDAYLGALEAQYPSLGRPAAEIVQGLGLSAQEQLFLRSVDGGKPLQLLRQTSALDKVHASQLLAVLVLTGSVRLDQAQAQPPAPAPEKAQRPAEVPEAPPARAVSSPELAVEVSASSPPSPGARLRDRVMSMYLRLKGRSDDEQLQVRCDASKQEIEEAFKTQTQELESIRTGVHTAVDAETLIKVEEMISELQGARDRLLSGAAKPASSTLDQHSNRQGKLRAEMAYQQGMLQLAGGELESAAASFQQAAKLQPEAQEYRMFQLWVTYRLSKEKEERAAVRRDLRNIAVWVTRHNQEHPKAQLIMGQLLLEERKYDAAERHLQAASQLDSKDVEVTRALKLLAQKRPAEEAGAKGKPKKKFRLF